jgi:hypothetical protein
VAKPPKRKTGDNDNARGALRLLQAPQLFYHVRIVAPKFAKEYTLLALVQDVRDAVQVVAGRAIELYQGADGGTRSLPGASAEPWEHRRPGEDLRRGTPLSR